MSDKAKATLGCVSLILIIVLLVVGGYAWRWFVSPSIRGLDNTIDARIQKMDDATRYATQKQVEDTCRAMIASYNTDRLTYEQYRDSDNREKQGWGEQAKMRANKTASTYNNYILENSFIWQGNVPRDITEKLVFLQ